MKIRILGDTIISSNSAYRGLYREEPIYRKEHELYCFWDWYATEAGDGGYISDVVKASRLVETYAKNGMCYEIIRIEEEEVNTVDCFLGIDICTKGGYSLLASRFENTNENKTEMDGIFELIEVYFKTKLNGNSLFETNGDATLFLRVINEIQQIKPGMIEEDIFRKYYLYKINNY